MARRAAAPVGLVLGGGGSKGAFQVGAISTLVGDLGLRPDVIAGTSVGALNALVLAHARTPDEYPEMVTRLLDIWTSLREPADMYLPRPWLSDVTPQLRRAALDIAAGRLRTRAVADAVRSAGTLRRVVAGFRAEGDAVYSLDPVERRVRAEVEPDRVRAAHARIRLSVVELESASLRWIDGTGALYEADATTPAPAPGGPVHLADAVLASAAFTPAFAPRRMAGGTYADGGFRTVLPVRGARAMGAGPIIAIACAHGGVGRARSMESANLVELSLRAASATLAEVAARDTEDLARGPGLLVSPTVDVHGFLEVDPGRLGIEMDLGRLVAAERVEAAGGLDRILRASAAGEPRVEDPGALDTTASLTRGVARLRMDAWGHEERLLVGAPRAGAAEALEAVRIRKWLLRRAIAARGGRPGIMPAGADGWWRGFERHAGVPAVQNPWAGLSAANGGPVAPVDPDGYEPPTFILLARGTGERWRVAEGVRRRTGTAVAEALPTAVGQAREAAVWAILVEVDPVLADLLPEA